MKALPTRPPLAFAVAMDAHRAHGEQRPGRHVPAAHRNARPRFGLGVGDLIVNTVEFIDRTKVVELYLTDLLLMVLPRTATEYFFRDEKAKRTAAREAFTREISGTVSLLALIGVIGHGFRLAHDHLAGLFNPKRVYARAWINDGYLEHMKKQFDRTLAEFEQGAIQKEGPNGIRTRFIRRVLGAVENGDDYFLARVEQSASTTLGRAAQPNKARMVAQLSRLLGFDRSGKDGILPLDEMARAALRERVADLTEAAMADMRLKISQEAMKHEPDLLEKMVNVLNGNRYSSTLRFDFGKQGVLAMDQKVALKTLKHFMEQFADRALASDNVGKTLQELVDYSHRSKIFLTWIPMVLTLGIAMSVAKLNNMVTRWLNGGRDMFPGDPEGVTQGGGRSGGNADLKAAANNIVNYRRAVLSNRPDSPFNGFGRAMAYSEGGVE